VRFTDGVTQGSNARGLGDNGHRSRGAAQENEIRNRRSHKQSSTTVSSCVRHARFTHSEPPPTTARPHHSTAPPQHGHVRRGPGEGPGGERGRGRHTVDRGVAAVRMRRLRRRQAGQGRQCLLACGHQKVQTAAREVCAELLQRSVAVGGDVEPGSWVPRQNLLRHLQAPSHASGSTASARQGACGA
jgi:hypothetical protein